MGPIHVTPPRSASFSRRAAIEPRSSCSAGRRGSIRLCFAALVSNGHEVACHGDDHRLLAFAPPSVVSRQLLAWEEAVEAALGSPGSRLLRTPHGFRSPWLAGVARSKGYVLCGWDGSVFDTAEPGTETIVSRVVPLLRPGAVVLLHDGDGSRRGASREQTVAAIEPILAAADVLGLRSTTLGSLLGVPEAGPLGAFAS